MEKIVYRPIGIVRTPFKTLENMPIQPSGAKGVEGVVQLEAEYEDGLKDLEGFSHIILIYHFHKSNGYSHRVVPFLDDVERGLFATRAPKRPNPVGLSVVELKSVEGAVLRVVNIDVLDGTPLLDIKPYVPNFDAQGPVRTGWLENASIKATGKRSDKRFAD
jgi:tRNA (adenine37-N6)-methyltransferase